MAPVVVFTLLAVVLITAAVIDSLTQRVPNALTYGGMAAGLVCWAILGLIHGGGPAMLHAATQSAIAMMVGLIGFTVLFALGGLGGGDVKLMGAVGAIGGTWKLVLATTFYGFVVAAVIALIVMIRRGLVRRTMGRLLGVALLAGSRVKADLPEDSPRIPVAVGMCVGGLYAAAELLLGLTTPITPKW